MPNTCSRIFFFSFFPKITPKPIDRINSHCNIQYCVCLYAHQFQICNLVVLLLLLWISALRSSKCPSSWFHPSWFIDRVISHNTKLQIWILRSLKSTHPVLAAALGVKSVNRLKATVSFLFCFFVLFCFVLFFVFFLLRLIGSAMFGATFIWWHVLDYHNFRNNGRQKRLSKNGVNTSSKMVNYFLPKT